MDNPKSKFLNVWTEEETALLRSLAGRKCAREIAPLVGHTRFATLKKLEILGLKGFAPGRQGRWTDAQMEALRRVPVDTPGISCRQFAREQGLGHEAVRHWARKLGIVFHRDALWTGDQVARLRELAPTHTLVQLVAELRRTRRAVRYKAEELGIQYARERRQPKPRPAKTVREKTVRITPRALVITPKPPRPRTVVMAKPSRPVLRQVEYRGVCIEYCPECHAPVSNWAQHFERMGHRPPQQQVDRGYRRAS